VRLGKFKNKRVECVVAACTYPGTRRFKSPEEKRTDVNIAVQMLDDAYQDACDTLVLVSGDSDLVPAVARVKARFPNKKVVVYIPSRDPDHGAAYELRGSEDEHRDLPLSLLKHAQFPKDVPDGAGGFVTKPTEW
jgi:6-hydroxy-3-succinoylpyridine 3-monooxygenase